MAGGILCPGAIRVVVMRCLVIFVLVLAACGDRGETAAGPADLYRIEGEIVSLPAPDARIPRLEIRHGAVPDFKNRQGDIEGMKAMTMSFELADDVDISTLREGDSIVFTLEVVWQRDSPARIVEVTKQSGS